MEVFPQFTRSPIRTYTYFSAPRDRAFLTEDEVHHEGMK
jgi:hypothetical protein